MAATAFWKLAIASRRLVHDPLERLAMKRRERRPFEVFSLSFLDCICCGFGAIILLFVLNKMGEPRGARAGAPGPRGPAGPARGGAPRDPRRDDRRSNRDLRGPRASSSRRSG